MNQVRDWSGHCQRCFNQTDTHIMSMFDVALICMTCYDSERDHPRYEEAREIETAAAKDGNLNYAGIGKPEDLQRRLCQWPGTQC